MKKFFLSVAMVATVNAHAWNRDCDHQKDLEVTLDPTAGEELSVVAGAGDLEIVGKAGAREARAWGRVCASEPEWLDEAEILTEGGRRAEITVLLPDTGNGWGITGNRYVYMDLRVEVPNDLALEVQDSSGDMKIEGTASLTVRDSSGNIDVEDVTGTVVLSDSSGDIDLLHIEGDVNVKQDSSGDIYGRDILGSVLVERDSSGDIRFRDVRDDFVVERDSSGDIVAESVGRDFRVVRDGSGDIDARGVSGAVDIPDKG